MTFPNGELRRPTAQQAAPLAVRDASVALSAGAGCGKTFVLTERFLRDLEGPEPRLLRSMVALTFTEKAARELRQRIRDNCRAKLASGADPTRWRDLLRALEAAAVGTFHEYCGHWLRRNAVRAGIDAEFAVLDAAIAGTVREESLARSLRRWLSERDSDEHAALVELAVEFGMRGVRPSLDVLISERSAGDLGEWVGRTAEEVVALWKSVWESEARPALLSDVIESAKPCLALLQDQECTHPVMRKRRQFLLDMVPVLNRTEDPAALLVLIKEHARVQGGGNESHWASPVIYENVKRYFESLRKHVKETGEKLVWNEEAAVLAAGHGLRFARLALSARQEYEKAKRTRGGLDFDDLLLKTRDLLRDSEEGVRDDLTGMLSLLLVDEFQDTDPVQGEILRMLGGTEFPKGRLFLVGDSKQSIYRFRGARPRIFQDFRVDFPIEGHHSLTENFRSVPGVLDFVNTLFHGVFPDLPENVRLVPGAGAPARRDEPTVEFLWAVEPKNENDAKNSRRDDLKFEAGCLARRLRQRLDEGWPIRDPKDKHLRMARAGDVAFLFKAMTSVAPFESALYAEGFDYHTRGGSAFYAQQEINDLINLLSVIEDPFDAVALVGALRSPFFSLSDDGLFWLAADGRDLPDGLRQVEDVRELSNSDRDRAIRARRLLQHWRNRKDREPIAALVHRVLDESGYEAALLGEFLGDRKRANARKLVRMARNFDEQGGFTLAAFVARLRADLRNPPREEQAATTDEDGESIRLMSIHQAKGLEFPIVVLPDLDRTHGNVRKAVAFDPELGPLVRLTQDFKAEAEEDETTNASGESLGWRIYSGREQREEDEEALRLFYVATTRAMDALVLSAAVDPNKRPRSPALKLLDRQFIRETGKSRVALPEGWEEPRVRVVAPIVVAAEATRSRLRQPRLLEVARSILAASESEEYANSRDNPGPPFVDLDPTQTLSPTAARLDRLIRTILSDPRGLNTRDLPAVASKSARKQTPAAQASLVDQAVSRLSVALDGPIGRLLEGATELRRGVSWTLAWPPESDHSSVFHGRIDLLHRDRQSEWRIIMVSDPAAPAARERLRLMLSAHAANQMGHGPVREGWRIPLGKGAPLREERFDAEAIEMAAREFFAS